MKSVITIDYLYQILVSQGRIEIYPLIAAMQRTFNKEVQLINESRSEKSKSGNLLSIIGFDCDGRQLRARATSAHTLPFSLPIFSIKEFTNVVEVAVTVHYS